MSVTAPPRPPRPSGPDDRDQPIDREELEAIIEALIEEARRARGGADGARRLRRARRACRRRPVLRPRPCRWRHHRRARGRGLERRRGGRGARRGGRWGLSHGPDGGPCDIRRGRALCSADGVPGHGRGVFRSTNGGRSWTSGGLFRRFVMGRRFAGVTSLLVDPRTPTTCMPVSTGSGLAGCGTAGRPIAAVYKTSDGGRTWRALDLRRSADRDQSDGSPTVYAATGGPRKTSRLVRSTDGGRSWQPADRGLPPTYLWALAFDPSTPATVYAAMGQRGIFESSDGGARWRAVRVSRRTAR